MVDLAPFGPHVTEFRRHEVECHCGYRTRAPYDPEKIPASPFGPRLCAVVVLLTGVYHLSRQRTKKLLHELFGIEMSVGAVSAIEARASTAVVSAVEEVEREVERAGVKYTDGTTWLEAGVTLSLWTLACAAVTLYKILKDGRSKTIRPLFGALRGILVSDRATVFGFWLMVETMTAARVETTAAARVETTAAARVETTAAARVETTAEPVTMAALRPRPEARLARVAHSSTCSSWWTSPLRWPRRRPT